MPVAGTSIVLWPLPGALPMIFAGFKLGMGTALLLIVAAELTAARPAWAIGLAGLRYVRH